MFIVITPICSASIAHVKLIGYFNKNFSGILIILYNGGIISIISGNNIADFKSDDFTTKMSMIIGGIIKNGSG